MKQSWIKLVAPSIAIAMVLVGCSKGTDTGEKPAAPGATEISFLLAEGPEELDTFQEIANAYNESQTDVHVTLVSVSEGEDLTTRLSTDVASGNAPDVFFSNYRFVDGFVSKGLLSPITDRVASATAFTPEDFYPVALDAFNFGGEQYCMPFNASSLVVYYNEKLFEEAGIKPPADDWTWKDMVADAKALTGLQPVEGGATGAIESDEEEEGGAPPADPDAPALDASPAAPVPGDERTSGLGVDPQLIRVAPFVWSAGGELADVQENPTKLTMTSLPAQKALNGFLGLNARDHVVPSEGLMSTEGLESLFVHGSLGMLMESRKIVPTLRTITGFGWDVAPLPRIGPEAASVLHSDGYCISEGAKHPDEAWDFIDFAVSEQGQKIAAETGRAVPSMIQVAESEAFLNPDESPSRSQVWLDQLPNTRAVPVVANWVEVEDIANAVLEEGFFGQEDAPEVGDQIDRQTKPLLAGE